MWATAAVGKPCHVKLALTPTWASLTANPELKSTGKTQCSFFTNTHFGCCGEQRLVNTLKCVCSSSQLTTAPPNRKPVSLTLINFSSQEISSLWYFPSLVKVTSLGKVERDTCNRALQITGAGQRLGCFGCYFWLQPSSRQHCFNIWQYVTFL